MLGCTTPQPLNFLLTRDLYPFASSSSPVAAIMILQQVQEDECIEYDRKGALKIDFDILDTVHAVSLIHARIGGAIP